MVKSRYEAQLFGNWRVEYTRQGLSFRQKEKFTNNGNKELGLIKLKLQYGGFSCVGVNQASCHGLKKKT